MIRVVLDTVVFVRSLINPYGRWGELVFKYFDAYQLFVSREVVGEILEVLQRPELTLKFRPMKNLDYSRVIELLGQAEVVEITESYSGSRDHKDDKFLATADAARADYLVTEDEDLLVLKKHGVTKIIDSLEFLRILEKSVI
ncbi:MAG: PilT protein domain-containing protein [Microgenomates group bacterium Gr01-1014_16]|nr:MAG: PilT protein domain-containing protein [Microgenomates group bacterium Gr01-1014_16]